MILEESVCGKSRWDLFMSSWVLKVQKLSWTSEKSKSGGAMHAHWCCCCDGTHAEKTPVGSHLFLKCSANERNLPLWALGVKSRSYSKHQQQPSLCEMFLNGKLHANQLRKRQHLWFIKCMFVACVSLIVSLCELHMWEIWDFKVISPSNHVIFVNNTLP